MKTRTLSIRVTHQTLARCFLLYDKLTGDAKNIPMGTIVSDTLASLSLAVSNTVGIDEVKSDAQAEEVLQRYLANRAKWAGVELEPAKLEEELRKATAHLEEEPTASGPRQDNDERQYGPAIAYQVHLANYHSTVAKELMLAGIKFEQIHDSFLIAPEDADKANAIVAKIQEFTKGLVKDGQSTLQEFSEGKLIGEFKVTNSLPWKRTTEVAPMVERPALTEEEIEAEKSREQAVLSAISEKVQEIQDASNKELLDAVSVGRLERVSPDAAPAVASSPGASPWTLGSRLSESEVAESTLYKAALNIARQDADELGLYPLAVRITYAKLPLEMWDTEKATELVKKTYKIFKAWKEANNG